MKSWPVYLIVFISFLFLHSPVLAAPSLTISADKLSLHGEEEVKITATYSGFTPGETVFIKGAFSAPGSTNYFGYTKNGDTWIKNSAQNNQQRQVVIGQWDNTLIVKADFADSGFKGEGDYGFKVRFYYGDPDNLTGEWSENSLTIVLSEPDPTPTPTPTAIPTSTPSPTNTPTPTPTKIPTPTSTPLKAAIKTTISPTSSTATIAGAVSRESSPTGNLPEPTLMSEQIPSQSNRQPLIIAFIFVALGLALASGVLVWQRFRVLNKTPE